MKYIIISETNKIFEGKPLLDVAVNEWTQEEVKLIFNTLSEYTKPKPEMVRGCE